jgi:two-component system cell cycle sensor histidine kinase/response regulator CckA
MTLRSHAFEALSHELRRERIQNAKRINLFRVCTVSLFFALFFLLGQVLRMPAWTGNLPLFGIYWVAGVVVYWASRRVERIARLSSLTVALFDVPMVFFLQWATFPTTPSTSGVAGFTIAVYVALVILSALSLESWCVWVTAGVGAVFGTLLQYLAGVSVGAMISSVILLALAATACHYGRLRLVALVGRVERNIAERRRTEAALHHAERMAALGALGRELSGTLDPVAVAERTTESVTGLIGAKSAVLFRLDAASGDLVGVAASGPMARAFPPGLVVAAGTSAPGLAVATRRAVTTPDVLADPAIRLDPELRARIEEAEYRSECAVPLVVRGTVWGALGVGDVLGRAFAPDEVHLIQAFADHAALALENARLYAELATRLHELETAQEQVLRAGKLAAVGQLASGVAHEINNPLAVIVGQAEMLRLRLPGADLKQRAHMIQESAMRASRIVRELQTFVRARPREVTAVDLRAVVEWVIALRQEALRVSGIELTGELPPASVMVQADTGQLQQVVLNLVLNAEHALAGRPERRIAVRAYAEGDRACVSVADTGPGVPPEVLPRIFEPFFTTKPIGKGTGLGLAICNAIVQGHGGRLVVETAVDRGSTFVVELAAHEGVATAAPAAAAARPTLGGGRVLVVDDEEFVARTLRGFLEDLGMEVSTVATAAAAWRALCTGATSFDAITLDLRMPGASGQELYDRLARDSPAVAARVIFVTGDTADPDTQAFLEQTGRPVLLKPFQIEALSVALARVLVAGRAR